MCMLRLCLQAYPHREALKDAHACWEHDHLQILPAPAPAPVQEQHEPLRKYMGAFFTCHRTDRRPLLPLDAAWMVEVHTTVAAETCGMCKGVGAQPLVAFGGSRKDATLGWGVTAAGTFVCMRRPKDKL